MLRLATLVVLALALAGCGSGPTQGPDGPLPPATPACPTPTTPDADPGATAPAPLPVQDGFEAPALDDASPMPYRATDGTWAVRPDADAFEGANVLVGQGDAAPGFSALLVPAAGEPGDVDLSFAFRIGCVEHPHGVGAVLHVADGGRDYQIVRYSASESSWDFFTVRGGERTKHDEAWVGEGTDPEPGEWAVLRVTSQAGRVQAYDGATLVLDFQLAAEDAAAGQVGFFLRGSSDAAFDDLRVGVPGLP